MNKYYQAYMAMLYFFLRGALVILYQKQRVEILFIIIY